MTNREFARTNEVFKTACVMAAIEPTKRQASKFRRSAGSAFGVRKEAIAAIELAKQSNSEAAA